MAEKVKLSLTAKVLVEGAIASAAFTVTVPLLVLFKESVTRTVYVPVAPGAVYAAPLNEPPPLVITE